MKKVLLLGCLALLAGCDKPDTDDADYYIHEGRTVADWLNDVRTEAPDGAAPEAARAIARLGPSDLEAMPALVRALKDENPAVRWVACTALGNMGPKALKGAGAQVAKLMNDPNKSVQRAAIRAYNKMLAQPRPQPVESEASQ
jgi:HEAT repeat protein